MLFIIQSLVASNPKRTHFWREGLGIPPTSLKTSSSFIFLTADAGLPLMYSEKIERDARDKMHP